MKFLEGVLTAEPCSDISHPPALPSFWLKFGVSCWIRAPDLKKFCGLFIPAIYLPPRMASDPVLCPPVIGSACSCSVLQPIRTRGPLCQLLRPSQAGKNHLPAITFQLPPSGDHHKPAQPGLAYSPTVRPTIILAKKLSPQK